MDEILNFLFKELKQGCFIIDEYIQTAINTEGVKKETLTNHVLCQEIPDSLINMLIKYERYEDCQWLIDHCKENRITLNK